jgi:hypothetical protein
LTDIRYESHETHDFKRIWTLSNWLHNLPLKLNLAKNDRDYFTVLQDVFDRARGNLNLHYLMNANFPQLAQYEYELWHGNENGQDWTTLIPCNAHREKYRLLPFEKLALRFYAVDLRTAQRVNNDFLSDLTSKK